MSHWSLLSWVMSGVLHSVVLALLGVLCTAPVMEPPEIAGDRVLISSAFASPAAPAAEQATPVEVVAEVTPPAVEPPPVVEPPRETELLAKSEPEPVHAQPLDLDDLPLVENLRLPEVERQRLPRVRPDMLATLMRPERRPYSPPRPVPEFDPARQTFTRPRLHEPEPEIEPVDVPPVRRATPAPVAVPDISEDVADQPPADTVPQYAGTTQTKPARPLRNPHPVYPADAVRDRLQGLVILRVTISSEGTVTAVTIAESSGHRQFDRAARDAVLQWRFEPATRAGQAVEWTARLPIRFRLN